MGDDKRRALMRLIPHSKAAARTITEIWKLMPKTYDRVGTAHALAVLAEAGAIKRFKVDGPKGNPVWKYWLDPMHG